MPRCTCWGLNEGCPYDDTLGHTSATGWDEYEETRAGTDGRTWKRYTRMIPVTIDKNNLTIKIRHFQQSWDNTSANSGFFLDSIYFSDMYGNKIE
ncbi:MAG: hypothetical protein JXB88_26900 [Spirochaetales bacterium]|nr:hypothetical protein [Spirochaetales bacterium]